MRGLLAAYFFVATVKANFFAAGVERAGAVGLLVVVVVDWFEAAPEDAAALGFTAANAAITALFWLKTIVHVVEAPEHAPAQPANTQPESGSAVSVTCVPISANAMQPAAVMSQEMPDGDDVTSPEPTTLSDSSLKSAMGPIIVEVPPSMS
jgi:hypothetical protein